MSERPILFSGPMVRAIIAGTKTQTRRALTKQPPSSVGKIYAPFIAEPNNWQGIARDDLISWYGRCPFGAPGDRLWVRETWAVDAPLEQVRREREDVLPPEWPHGPYYRASGTHGNSGLTWRPAIHMPRWACRLVLEVTGVRAERLQEISSDDAIAEGIEPHDSGDAREEAAFNRAGYAELWDSLNKARGLGWNVNPWVWVIEFKRAA